MGGVGDLGREPVEIVSRGEELFGEEVPQLGTAHHEHQQFVAAAEEVAQKCAEVIDRAGHGIASIADVEPRSRRTCDFGACYPRPSDVRPTPRNSPVRPALRAVRQPRTGPLRRADLRSRPPQGPPRPGERRRHRVRAGRLVVATGADPPGVFRRARGGPAESISANRGAATGWNIVLPVTAAVTPAASAGHASTEPSLDAPEDTKSPERWHVFISYAKDDTRWVRMLAENLYRLGLDVFFDEWEVNTGAVVATRLDEGLRASRTGVLVVSRTSVERPWVLQEYAALLRNAVERDQPLIPVLLEDAEVPAMLATRLCIDFRGKRGQDYVETVQELASAIRGEQPRRPTRGSRLETP
ncbi:toll/interleukin-1 receptor domain-containing protein [Nannocystis pusilla]|uniref:toll/interleukin-1 receptor domain-containing protein n=1 Tax=Nannocystis pusilla TaxID=889268 RepID=UPI003B82A285